MMLTIDRLVTALVCEDHMLQAVLYDSDVRNLGNEIFGIYKSLFDEWNRNKDIDETRIWEASANRNFFSGSYYIIKLTYSSPQGATLDQGIVRVNKSNGDGKLVIGFSGVLIYAKFHLWYDAKDNFTRQSPDNKKKFLSEAIHKP